MKSIDEDNPSSLSKKMNELLRNELGFTGVIITDDLDMGAVSKEQDAVVRAILAGNDLIIVTDYEASIEAVKIALEEGRVSEEDIGEKAKQIIAWKFYKEMM